jgi:hypothetical protein
LDDNAEAVGEVGGGALIKELKELGTRVSVGRRKAKDKLVLDVFKGHLGHKLVVLFACRRTGLSSLLGFPQNIGTADKA